MTLNKCWKVFIILNDKVAFYCVVFLGYGQPLLFHIFRITVFFVREFWTLCMDYILFYRKIGCYDEPFRSFWILLFVHSGKHFCQDDCELTSTFINCDLSMYFLSQLVQTYLLQIQPPSHLQNLVLCYFL